jgi:2-dehydro-3-deoxyphosphogluconate aldolase/(4S)-4-hydroxy-2-oxoglutarate aldolase
LAGRGYEVDMDTAKYKDGSLTAVYLKDEIGGFAIHLLRK